MRDTSDRRIIKVDLTERGKEVLKKFRAEHKEHMISFLKALNETDKKSFIKTMDTIFKVVTKYSDSQS